MERAFKYIEQQGEFVRPKQDEKTMNVALSIALGTDYGKYDIDPIEAYLLVWTISDFAKQSQNVTLIKSCDKVMAQLKLHAQAFALTIDHNLELI